MKILNFEVKHEIVEKAGTYKTYVLGGMETTEATES